MKNKNLHKMREKLEEKLKRPAKPHEVMNLQSDALALAKYCLEEIERLEDLVDSLLKKVEKK